LIHLILQALSHLFPGTIGALLRELAAKIAVTGL
jgi:hypothetical protein